VQIPPLDVDRLWIRCEEAPRGLWKTAARQWKNDAQRPEILSKTSGNVR
jgi:hypothetical protein